MASQGAKAGTSTSRGGGRQGQGQQRQQGLQQGRVYTASSATTSSDPSVVKGTFLVFNTWADVLIDSGASHSFIHCICICHYIGVKVLLVTVGSSYSNTGWG